MRRGTRIAVMVGGALMLGVPQVPASEGRVPSERTFHLRMLGDTQDTACSRLFLTPEDGPDAVECGFTLLKVLPPCPAIPACELPDPPRVWRTVTLEDPLVLDASRPASGVVALTSWGTGICTRESCTTGPRVGVGRYTLTVTMSATVGGVPRTVGSSQLGYDVVPGSDTVFPFEIDVPAGLDGAHARGLTLAVSLRGQGALHGVFELERTNPRVTVPVFECDGGSRPTCD